MTAFPAGKTAQGQGALWYLPAVAGPNGPTLAEITAGIELSCAFYAFNPQGSQAKIERRRYCSVTVYEIFGAAKVSIDDMEFVYDPQNPTSVNYPWYSTMKNNVGGWLMHRLGLPFDTAPAVSPVQYVTLYPITCGLQIPVGVDSSNDSDEIRYKQGFALAGSVRFDKPILAS